MSSSNRTTSKGGKGSKTDKTHKSEKSDSGKGTGGDKQNTSRTEEPDVKEKVKQLMEMSQRPEDDVCLVLHECDYDLNLACNKLLEAETQGEWEMRVKKKKSRQLSTSKQDNKDEAIVGGGGGGPGGGGVVGADEWIEINPQTGANQTPNETKEKGRGKGGISGGGGGGPPPRLHGRHNDRWRGREKQENEKNLENGSGGGGGGGGRSGGGEFQQRRSRTGGSIRPGGGRGRGGGRAGGRYPPRGNRNNTGMYKPIDTWDNSNTWDNNTATEANHNPSTENWDDFPGTDEWSTEEYTGSLADTKVFTPSVQTPLDTLTEQQVVDGTIQQQQQQQQAPQQPPSQNAPPTQISQQLIGQQQTNVLQQQQTNPVPIVGTLNAAQTQYLTQLTQQTSENMSKQYGSGTTSQYGGSGASGAGAGGVGGGGGGVSGNAQVYNSGATLQYSNTQQYGGTGTGNTYNVNSNYDTVNSYGTQQEQTVSQPPTRTKTQRARVPPPSKIPSSAVEMPGDLNSSIGYLDVQFGAMDLIDSNTFDNDSNKYSGSGSGGGVVVVSGNTNSTNTTNLDNTNTAQQTVNNLDLNTSNVVQNTTLDGYSQKSSISSTLTQNTNEHLGGVYAAATARNSAQVSTGGNQATSLDINKTGDSQSYTQSTNYNSYQQKSNTYNSTTYGAAQTTSSYVSNQANSYVNNQSGTYNPSSATNYQNTYSSTTSSYQSNTNSTGPFNSFPPNNQTYPQNTSQSVYSGNTGLSSSNFGNTNTSQYNSYTSANSHKLNKDNTYENSTNSVTSSQTTTTSNVTSSTSLSISQTTLSSSKTTTTLAAKNSNSVVSNIPPGVAPVMSTPYIMGQVPYFQQPIPYSYEEMQLLQQRLPHMTTPYYDMSYQTPTTMAPVRDGTLSNVGYSTISDGRFTRGDNNASPVPSTLSQQTSTLTQGHQAQPILPGTAAPYFFAATPFNTIPNYQFGTMYTQLPAATNAHGSSNSNQYSKPATYGSGYGTYDALSQTQDYTKAGYVGSTQGQKGSGANASSTVSTGSDLSAMYPKTHTTLGKVNSYEKQGFHSGTPPPQILHGNHNAGLTPSGTGYPPQVYIPTMAPHQQHHSTPLMHQPLHQMDIRHQGRRVDSGNSSGQRSQTANQAKASGKQSYPTSYWNQA